MASLRRAGRYWHVRFRDAKRTPPEVVVSLHVADYTEAQARRHLRDLEADFRAGRFDPWSGVVPGSAVVSLSEAVERYIDYKTSAGRRGQRGGWNANNAIDRAYLLRAFVRGIGDRPVASVTAAHVEDYVYAFEVAQPTQAGRRSMMTAFLSWLRKEGLATLPALPPVQQVRRLPPYLTVAEMEAVCAEIVADSQRSMARKHAPKVGPSRVWMTDAVRFAFFTGMRLNEIISLRVSAIRLDKGTVQVGDDTFVTKTKKEDVIPLVPGAADIVRPLVEGRPAEARVFDHRDGHKLSLTFRKAARAAVPTKPSLHFHSLRHSCAVYWRGRGVALEDIRDLLRHSTIKTTEIYDQISPADLGERFSRAAQREN